MKISNEVRFPVKPLYSGILLIFVWLSSLLGLLSQVR